MASEPEERWFTLLIVEGERRGRLFDPYPTKEEARDVATVADGELESEGVDGFVVAVRSQPAPALLSAMTRVCGLD